MKGESETVSKKKEKKIEKNLPSFLWRH